MFEHAEKHIKSRSMGTMDATDTHRGDMRANRNIPGGCAAANEGGLGEGRQRSLSFTRGRGMIGARAAQCWREAAPNSNFTKFTKSTSFRKFSGITNCKISGFVVFLRNVEIYHQMNQKINW